MAESTRWWLVTGTGALVGIEPLTGYRRIRQADHSRSHHRGVRRDRFGYGADPDQRGK